MEVIDVVQVYSIINVENKLQWEERGNDDIGGDGWYTTVGTGFEWDRRLYKIHKSISFFDDNIKVIILTVS